MIIIIYFSILELKFTFKKDNKHEIGKVLKPSYGSSSGDEGSN